MPSFPVDVLKANQSAVDPTAEADSGKLYSKSVLGVTQPYYRASDSTITQLNGSLTDGSIPYSSLTNKLNVNTKATVLLQTAAQGIFDLSIDTVTLLSNTTYLVQGVLAFTAVINVNGTSINSSFPGTATYTSFNGSINTYITQSLGISVGASNRANHITTAASTAISQALPVTTRDLFCYYNLIAVVNAGGTMTPSIGFSAIPGNGTAIRMATMEIIPVGSNTFTNQNWA